MTRIGPVTLAVALVVSVSAPQAAAEPVHPPFSVEMTPFSAAGSQDISVHAEPRRSRTFLCAGAKRISGDASTRLVREHGGCTPDFHSYTFDPSTYRVAAVGEMGAPVIQHTQEFVNGHWRTVSSEIVEEDVSVRLDLTWTATGDPQVAAGAVHPGPSVCIRFPADLTFCAHAHAVMWRDATVTGEITFDGLDLVAVVPEGHEGRISIENPRSVSVP